MNLLLYMSPIAVLFLLPVTLVMEPTVLSAVLSLGSGNNLIWILLLVNSAMAYFVNLSNFLVTKHTSPLTLQVLGNAKGAVAVVISIFLFRNPISFMGMAGYSLTVIGVVIYGETKRRYKGRDGILVAPPGRAAAYPVELLLWLEQELVVPSLIPIPKLPFLDSVVVFHHVSFQIAFLKVYLLLFLL
ncbi:UDP-URONIC ACID TRANSPORTER 1 [Asimina triloba]